ncbi:MAG: DNA-binding protein [Bacteroides sp.]|nr:DNA-binding protein [Bacteroides sp.]MBD5377879.1 DNA-binding protein [Bacteroides sp.]
MEANHSDEIILYKPDDTLALNVRVEDESVWLTQAQIVELFTSSKANISEHLKHIFESGELDREATVRKFRTVRMEGNRNVVRTLEFFNLDVIISVGYRVNTIRGVQFRQWANKILKDYLLRGYSLNQRIMQLEDRLDRRLSEHDRRLLQLDEKIDFIVRSSLQPKEGVFFDGQIFDAYALVAHLIRQAHTRIVLIDNYIDDSVLVQLSKRKPGVTVDIYDAQISRQLRQDVEKHNEQYPGVTLHKYTKAHDRFLIIDETVYHIGASLKDLGKKLFAFSRMEALTGSALITGILT